MSGGAVAAAGPDPAKPCAAIPATAARGNRAGGNGRAADGSTRIVFRPAPMDRMR